MKEKGHLPPRQMFYVRKNACVIERLYFFLGPHMAQPEDMYHRVVALGDSEL
jgi:hypothetical protein